MAKKGTSTVTSTNTQQNYKKFVDLKPSTPSKKDNKGTNKVSEMKTETSYSTKSLSQCK